jgi:hypothetical protein
VVPEMALWKVRTHTAMLEAVRASAASNKK